jgi:hypothetical protein
MPLALWSGWMTWQKIDYILANPVKARLVSAAKDYYWFGLDRFTLGKTHAAVP